MQYKRYIFLDVDGVLNHPAYYDDLHEQIVSGKLTRENWEKRDLLVNNCDVAKLELLNQLEGCEVVMVSQSGSSNIMEVCHETLSSTHSRRMAGGIPVVCGQ